MSSPIEQYRERLRQATERIAALRDALAAERGRTRAAVAVVGLGCRLPPDVADPERFFDGLLAGADAIAPAPRDRYGEVASTLPPGGYLAEVRAFDAAFFGISPREAAAMDPQQRLLLEVVWEALERAGLPPESLPAERVGVFLGIAGGDYLPRVLAREPDIYALTGNGGAFASGRLAYSLGFRGPCLAVDTACSSSLVTVHLAVQSLRRGECDTAIVAGVNLIVEPDTTRLLQRSGALAPDGRCKTFDAAADGFTRAEGAVAVVLQRADHARSAGAPLLATIRGSAIGQDGRSTGLTAPNVEAQKAMLAAALTDAGVEADSVGYVETHGTGTALGDPIEFDALRAVFGRRNAALPCVLGAVKTNVGHLEAAAGLVGLLKAIGCLQRGQIPRNLHFTRPNSHLELAGTPFVLPTATLPFPGEGPRRAGVSAFGMSGTNAHVVLEEAPPAADGNDAAETAADAQNRPSPPAADGNDAAETAADAQDRPRPPAAEPCLLTLSARHPAALAALAGAIAQTLDAGQPARAIARTAALHRSHHPHRLALVFRPGDDVAAPLRAFSRGDAAPDLELGESARRDPPVFVCAGQGMAWPGMGRGLLAIPAARATLEAAAAAVAEHGDFDLLAVLCDPTAPLARTDLAQPAIVAVTLALAAALAAHGIRPAAVIGHSVGELSAAHLAGALPFAEALRLACVRGRAMQRARPGAMVAVSLAPPAAAERLAGTRLEIAAINGPRATVIAGDDADVAALIDRLTADRIRCRRVDVAHAFHTAHMDPVLPAFAAAVGPLSPAAVTCPLYSTVTGARATGSELGVAHWQAGIRRPVRLHEALQAALADGHRLFLDLGPHPILGAADPGPEGRFVTTMRRDHDAAPALLRALAGLYVEGAPVDLAPLHPARGPAVALPTYPWQRKIHWIDRPDAPAAATGDLSPETDSIAPDPSALAAAALNGMSQETSLSARDPSALAAAALNGMSQETSLSAPDPSAPSAALTDLSPETAPVAPDRHLVERRVRAEIAAVLRLGPDETIPAQRGLFELGFDSMMSVELARRLARIFARPLGPTLAFDHPTLAALVDHLCADRRPTASARAQATREPIAILGMACRFPGGANDPDAFWDLLREGRLGIAEVPPDRWDRDAYYDPDPQTPGKMYVTRAGFLQDLDIRAFDAACFNISPAEARALDPQQRLLLELTWEALEDAGRPADGLAGTRTGIYVGIATSDYGQQLARRPLTEFEPSFATGCAMNTAAGRLAFVLGTRGPTLALDTACSSSLVATHLAVQSLRRGEIDLALVAGTNLMLDPAIGVLYSRMRALAPDGRCKAFDAAADGMVRGEGVAVVVLARLGDARRARDRVRAVIRGSAVNHDGRSSGLTVPSGPAQQAVIREALADAGVDGAAIEFVETHGTGTAIGDPIEANALLAELGPGRPADRPLVLGSAKANVGHLEPAAGLVGLIKVVQAIRHRTIPPQPTFTGLNPAIQVGDVSLLVPIAPHPWTGARLAGVSSFGISGTNAHIIVAASDDEPEAQLASTSTSEVIPSSTAQRVATATSDITSTSPLAANSNSKIAATSTSKNRATSTSQLAATSPSTLASPSPDDTPPAFVLPISARRPEALDALAQAWRARLADEDEHTPLADLCAAAALRRAHPPHRLAVAGVDRPALIAAIDAWRAGDVANSAWAAGEALESVRLAFVFSGHGGHWPGMGRRLLADEPAFARAFHECEAALARVAPGTSLVAALTAADTETRWHSKSVLHPLMLALQVSWAALWRYWGVVPAAVVGHSSGELAAAVAIGALSLEDAFRISLARCAAIEQIVGKGMMAVVGLPPEALEEPLARFAGRVTIAVHNAPRQVAISGDPDAVMAIGRELAAADVFFRPIPGADAAGHSHHYDPHLPALRAALADLRPRPARLPFYSTVTADSCDGEALGPDYWADNLRHRVRFADTAARLAREGIGAFLEIGPHPVLLPALAQIAPSAALIASATRNADDCVSLRAALGRLHVAGASIDWQRIHPAGSPALPLPRHPWHRQVHWMPPARATGAGRHPLVERELRLARSGEQVFEVELDADRLDLPAPTEVQGGRVLDPALLLEFAQVALGPARAPADLEFDPALPFEQRVALQLCLADGGSFEVFARADDGTWRRAATGRAVDPELPAPVDLANSRAVDPELPAPVGLAALRSRCTTLDEHHAERQRARGLRLAPQLDVLDRLWRGEHEALARLKPLGGQWAALAATASALHLLAALAFAVDTYPVAGELFWPRAVATLAPLRAPPAWLHVSLRGPASDLLGATGDAVFLDDSGRPLGALHGVTLAPPDRELARSAVATRLGQWVYALEWEPLATSRPPPIEPGTWLLLTDAGDVARSLAAALQAQGHATIVVPRAASLAAAIRDTRPGTLRGVVDLRPLDSLPTAPEIEQAAQAHIDQARLLVAESIPRLVVVTRRGQPVRPGERPDLSAAIAWALTRTLGLEHPDLQVRLVDLDSEAQIDVSETMSSGTPRPAAPHHMSPETASADPHHMSPETAAPHHMSPETAAAAPHHMSPGPARTAPPASAPSDMSPDTITALAREVLLPDPEDLVALRGNTRHGARLTPRPVPVPPAPLRLAPDATWLVTGGLGGVGLQLARWLVDRGARHLLLTGRQGPSDATPQARERLAAVQALRHAGADVQVVAVDVADEPAMRALLAAIPPAHPLRGVFHVAGVTRFEPLVQTSPGAVEAVLRAKVAGAAILDRLTRAHRLDHFVCFSSAAATWGAAGLGLYAAANHYLDLLAHRRRAEGLPALTIAWGGWAGGGMTDSLVRAGAAQMGLLSSPAQQLLEAMDACLQADLTHVTVGDVDWQIFKALLEARGERPLLRRIVAGPALTTDAPLALALRDVPPGERWPTLLAAVAARVAATLGFADPADLDPRRGFFQMGMDSMMAVRLRRALELDTGAALPPTLAIEQPTVERLARWLAREVLAVTAPDEPASTPAASDPPDDPLETRTEDELEALLAAELAEDDA